ncbi:MAG: LysR family transcriptional regulator [Peptostreptococcaceae bacterium]
MELLHLKYFQNVAKTEHITKSANELNIVQPALSRSIHNLEEELGVKLFDRKGRIIRLNENGKEFLKVVDNVLNNLESGKKKLLDMNGKLDNEIRLVVLSASMALPDIILQFRKLYPDTTFKLLQCTVDQLNTIDFDFCITPTQDKIDYPTNITLLEEEILLGVPTNHNLVYKNNINLQEVHNESFIAFSKDRPFRKISDTICDRAQFKPNIVFESDIPQMVCDLVKAGVGISLIPQKTWNVESDESMQLLSIRQPVCKRYLNLSWKPEHYLSHRSLLFKDFVIKYFKDL